VLIAFARGGDAPREVPVPAAFCGNYSPVQLTGSIVPGTTDTGNHCDDCTSRIALPFAYEFYGTAFTAANVSSNGTFQFSSNAQTNAIFCVPDAGHTLDSIYVYNADLTTTASGDGIFTSVTGAAPNRIFNIEWRTHPFGTRTTFTNFEIRLYESIPRFDLVYGSSADKGATAGGVGAQQGDGLAPNSYISLGCRTGALGSGVVFQFTAPLCNGPTATPTPRLTATPTNTPTTVPDVDADEYARPRDLDAHEDTHSGPHVDAHEHACSTDLDADTYAHLGADVDADEYGGPGDLDAHAYPRPPGRPRRPRTRRSLRPRRRRVRRPGADLDADRHPDGHPGDGDPDADSGPAGTPTVNTKNASSVNDSSAILNGQVWPNGSPTSAFFQLGRGTNYGHLEPAGAAGRGERKRQRLHAGERARLRHVPLPRRRGRNTAGTSLGDDMTFVTVACPRGDENGDTQVNVQDVFYLVNHLFSGGPGPAYDPGADANSDNELNVQDGVLPAELPVLARGPRRAPDARSVPADP